MTREGDTLKRAGVVVLRGVVPPELVRRAVRAICQWGDFRMRDRRSWYSRAIVANRGIVPLHHAQALWDIRQHPALHRAFARIWGTRRLMVSQDRCCFRPPMRRRDKRLGRGDLHWDVDPRAEHPGFVQGTVYLTDVGRNAGGFQCAPSVFETLGDRLADPDFDVDEPVGADDPIVQVEGRAGDLIVWDPRMPHGPAPNRSKRPRLAFFVKMDPWSEAARARCIAGWRDKRAPPWWRGLAGQRDPEGGSPPRLTALGRRLVGLRKWPG